MGVLFVLYRFWMDQESQQIKMCQLWIFTRYVVTLNTNYLLIAIICALNFADRWTNGLADRETERQTTQTDRQIVLFIDGLYYVTKR